MTSTYANRTDLGVALYHLLVPPDCNPVDLRKGFVLGLRRVESCICVLSLSSLDPYMSFAQVHNREVKMRTVCQTVYLNHWPNVTIMRKEVKIQSFTVTINETLQEMMII